MNYSWRITKYNPIFRDSQGKYCNEEWTSIFDVGKSFSGQVFTIQDYLQTEKMYIKAVLDFVEYLKLPGLKVTSLMKWTNEFKYSQYYSKEMIELYCNIKEDDILNSENLLNLCKLILRENLGCQLLYETKIFVHFGYDYYMYIGCDESCEDVIQKISKMGLFVEDFKSPYLVDEDIDE